MNELAHILVVDDDREIRNLLTDYLEKNGFRATPVPDASEARAAIRKAAVDLVVLDLMLPNESGLDLCREMRGSSGIPIIMLTALGQEMDRVVGLEVGADDYMSKPFSPRELLARIRAVLRRTAQAPDGARQPDPVAYSFGGWRLEMVSRTLRSPSGTGIALGGVDFGLLAALLIHAPRVLSREEMMELLHGRDFDPFDRSLDVAVSRLRKAMGEGARAPAIIRTVYGKGYVIGVPVEVE